VVVTVDGAMTAVVVIICVTVTVVVGIQVLTVMVVLGTVIVTMGSGPDVVGVGPLVIGVVWKMGDVVELIVVPIVVVTVEVAVAVVVVVVPPQAAKTSIMAIRKINITIAFFIVFQNASLISLFQKETIGFSLTGCPPFVKGD
jgi:hypothetical protein